MIINDTSNMNICIDNQANNKESYEIDGTPKVGIST